jgi:hypothetical protein
LILNITIYKYVVVAKHELERALLNKIGSYAGNCIMERRGKERRGDIHCLSRCTLLLEWLSCQD